MSPVPEHDCTGDGCGHCERAIERAEAERDDWGAASDWQIGQDRYEAHLDRMGGSR